MLPVIVLEKKKGIVVIKVSPCFFLRSTQRVGVKEEGSMWRQCKAFIHVLNVLSVRGYQSFLVCMFAGDIPFRRNMPSRSNIFETRKASHPSSRRGTSHELNCGRLLEDT